MTLLQSGLAKSLAEDYEIDNSVRFDDDRNTKLARTPSVSGNRKTFTLSFWTKRGNLGLTNARVLDARTSGTNECDVIFNSSDQLWIYNYIGSYNLELKTTQVFRDVSAWYHFVIKVDTTQGTASDRVKVYVNGEQITAWATETYPAEDYEFAVNQTGAEHSIGCYGGSDSYDYDGYLAEFYCIDGTALTPSSFGELSSTTNQWIPLDSDDVKDAVTFGTNGFYQKYNSTELADSFADSSVSGGRTQALFTVTANSGAVTKTDDKKFGTASLYTNNSSNQCLSIPDNAAFAFGEDTSDFTVECWFNWYAGAADWSALGGQLADDDNRFVFGLVAGGSATSGTITCHYSTGAIGSQITLTTSSSVTTSDGWHHLAYVRDGNTWSLYLDGTREATTTDSRNNHNTSARWTIAKSDNGADNVFNGYIDEFRISHGGSTAARYSGASYTVPTTAFTPDDSTILLLHMDGANDGTSFPDDGPHTITANGDVTNARGADLDDTYSKSESFTTVESTTWTVPAGVTSANYMVVAGGGGGG